tara:strand:+ start:5622 stop:10490 length:4869 start_codon:yes stop_codon:yes gene_type:complete
MPEVKNTFIGSKMNKTVDSRIMPKGEYRDALNFRISNSEGADAGAGENSLSNRKLTNFDLGTNTHTIGMFGDEFVEKIYWFVKSDKGSYILEYDNTNEVGAIVLEDTRVGDLNILNLNKDFLITGVNILIDSDKDVRFLLWTDGLNDPRQINIERAKSYGANNFDNDDISLYKKPPLNPPTIELVDTSSDQENNLEEKFLRFSTRFKYLDGEYSAMSPLSELAFEPKPFNYDYSISSNESMVNRFSAVTIKFNTGGKLITDIEVIFKESAKQNTYVIESFNKADKGWGDNVDVQFSYSNSKIQTVLSEKEIDRLFDNVPLKAFGQEILGNRVMYSRYTENIDIEDCDGNLIQVSLEADHSSTDILEGEATKSMKSNRDYELAVGYLYDGGRLTTPLTSEGNTVFVPTKDCVRQNELTLKINNQAPCDAEGYRIFLKQSKTLYDTIVPTLFYADGVYVWIKLEANEINKISVGEFLFVKADSSEILETVKQTKVLEIKTQPRNFLNPDATYVAQVAGVYFKIKPAGFRINSEDYTYYQFSGYDTSGNKYSDPIRLNDVNGTYIEEPVPYGLEESDDLTRSGVYTGGLDIRYLVEIETVGAVDTFRWSEDNGVNWVLTIPITGSPQLLSNGLSLTFGSITGHDIDDNWVVSAKSASDNGFGGQEGSKAYGIYKGLSLDDTDGDPDVIEGGASITIVYSETGDRDEYREETFISSSKYANLEEWFYKDGIQAQLAISDSRIWFRRGNVSNHYAGKYIDIDPTGVMAMIIRSIGTQNSDVDNKAKINTFISIFQSENDIIFETKPLDTNLDIFYEIGRTYGIDENGNHLGFDDNDVDQTSSGPTELILPVFNSFAWGNGFESYKIKDLLTTNTMGIDTRPSIPVRDYRKNNRISSITYSGVYEQSTNFNALNEFNLSLQNYKDLDDKYGKIEKIFGRDTNLLVFQEDKVLQVLFNKSILFNADGSGNVSQNLDVLGQEVPYAGEYGISNNPESFAIFGNQVWFTDTKRGAIMRLSIDGLTEISKYGMEDWYRDEFIANPNSKKLGVYDPYFDQYTLTIGDEPISPILRINCGATIYKTLQFDPFTYELQLNTLSGDIDIPYNVSEGSVVITAVFNESEYQVPSATGSGTLSFERDTLEEDVVTITITPVDLPSEYTLGHVCPLGEEMTVISIILNDSNDTGKTMTSRYKWDTSPFYSEIPVFLDENNEATLFKTNTGIQGLTRFPIQTANIRMEAHKDYINSGNFSEEESNTLSYLVTTSLYSEENIDIINNLKTPLGLTIINEGGVPETAYGEFTFDRPIGTENLYLIWDYRSIAITEDTYIYIYFDSSGSMLNTEAPLGEMRDTLLRDALLPFYNYDEDLYNSRVIFISDPTELTLNFLNIDGEEPEGNVVALVFQDEAEPIADGRYHDIPYTGVRTPSWDTGLAEFRSRLDSFDVGYYKGVLFAVIPNSGSDFKEMMQEVENGTGNYSGVNGLSDKPEVLFKYDITDGGTATYYLGLVTDALTELGFDLTGQPPTGTTQLTYTHKEVTDTVEYIGTGAQEPVITDTGEGTSWVTIDSFTTVAPYTITFTVERNTIDNPPISRQLIISMTNSNEQFIIKQAEQTVTLDSNTITFDNNEITWDSI